MEEGLRDNWNYRADMRCATRFAASSSVRAGPPDPVDGNFTQ